ncbi:immunoglobulin-binding protein 1-like [Ciona intestinalis]
MAEVEDRKIVDLFNEVWSAEKEISNSCDALSDKIQGLISDTLATLSVLSQSIEQLSMFSHNEEVDEISTQDLRYLMLNALAGHLISKKKCQVQERVEILTKSREFYVEFLKICRDYGVGPLGEIHQVLKPASDEEELLKHFPQKAKDLSSMTRAREAKIEKYKQSKLMEQQLSELQHNLGNDEQCRKYWLLVLNKWVNYVIEEMGSLHMEISMLKRMQNIPKSQIEEDRRNLRESIKPMQPFILTKDKLQAAVYGAGYPSLPTVTLDEYYEREAAAGRMPDQASKPASDKKEEEDSDDDFSDEKLMKKREFDDWKDTHRRGAGNRKNMG